MGKIWEAISEFLGKVIPGFIQQLYLKWMLSREEAGYDAFAAMRLTGNYTDRRSVASHLLRNNMAAQVIALVKQTKEREDALLVIGFYEMAYLMDVHCLRLPIVVATDRARKPFNGLDYQAAANHSTLHLYTYNQGQEALIEEHVWGGDPSEPLTVKVMADLEKTGRVQKGTLKLLKAARVVF